MKYGRRPGKEPRLFVPSAAPRLRRGEDVGIIPGRGQAVWEEIMRELTHLDVSERTEEVYRVTGLVVAALENYE